MKKHYLKIVQIIRHPGNKERHLVSISRIILQFQNMWFSQQNREGDWEYLEACAIIQDEYNQLLNRLNIITT